MSTLKRRPSRSAVHEDDVEMTYREAICAALRTRCLGPHVASPRGGRRGCRWSLQDEHGLFENSGPPDPNTPICENGFVGAAIGMAVTGLRPVVEIMFSDFLPDRRRRDGRRAAKVAFRVGRTVCGAGDRGRSLGWEVDLVRNTRATGESWYMGLPACRSRLPVDSRGRVRPASCDPRAQPGSSLRAQGPLRSEGRGDPRRGWPSPRSVARLSTARAVTSRLCNAADDRPERQASEQLAEVGIDGRSDRSSRLCVRSTSRRSNAASPRPADCSLSKSRCMPEAGAPRLSRIWPWLGRSCRLRLGR